MEFYWEQLNPGQTELWLPGRILNFIEYLNSLTKLLLICWER